MPNPNFESVLSALASVSGMPVDISRQSNGSSATANASLAGGEFLPISGAAFISSLLSISAMVQWLKLLVLGGIFEACRRGLLRLYRFFLDYLFITVDIADTDPCYNWVMVWLATQPSWNNARNIELGSEVTDLSGYQIIITNRGRSQRVVSTGERKLTFKPSHSSCHSFWFRRRWVRINRWEKEGTQLYRQKEEFLRLRILSRDHQSLNALLEEAEAVYKSAQENTISIYVSDSQHKRWRHLASRRKRPLNSIVLDPGIKDRLVNDAREFLASQDWYATRGIPFRRGYLLYGEPGTGKTSMIQSLAGELELDIYIISLSRAGLDDNELNELISRLPEKCIALMEDIDAAFISSINRGVSDENEDDSASNDSQPQKQTKHVSKVTLSGLLNALDGVAAQEGRLLFATTNKYHSLDPALTRPGRMDLHVEFELASKHQAKELYRRFYSPDREITGEVTAQAKEDEKDELSKELFLIDLDEPRLDATGGTSAASPSAATQQLLTAETHDPKPDQLAVLSKPLLDRLATAFSDTLPEREFSMAALQGYLMMYKSEPMIAVREFVTWIEQERRDKQGRERREKEEKNTVRAKAKEGDNAGKELPFKGIQPAT